MKITEQVKELIALTLREDIGNGDHSSLSCIPAEAQGDMKLLIKQAKKEKLPFAYIVALPLRQSATRLYRVDVKTGAIRLMKTDQNATPSDDERMNILAVSNKEDLFNVINPYTFTIIYPHSFLLNEIELNKATMEVQKEFEIPYPVSE